MVVKVVRLFLLLTVFLTLLSGQVQASGIGVSPHKLELEVYPLGSATSSLNVLNTSDERSQYQVYVEGEATDWFTITPEEFVLDPHDSREVKIVLSPSPMASGEHHASICIVSLVSASELKIGCGVKIPVDIRIISPPFLAMTGIDVTGLPLLGIVTAVALLLVSVVAGIFIWRRRKAYETQ